VREWISDSYVNYVLTIVQLVKRKLNIADWTVFGEKKIMARVKENLKESRVSGKMVTKE